MFSSNNIFNPILKFNLNFPRSGVIVKETKASVPPLEVHNVVFVLIITEVR